MSTTPSLALLLADDDRHRIDGERNSTAIRALHAANQENIPPTEELMTNAGDPAILLVTETEANPVDALLHALAGSLTAVLVYLAAARGARLTRMEPGEHLRQVVARARKRLGLTAREAEVLTLVARGFTDREIAAHLVISVRTAEHHVAHILRKLSAPNQRAAAAIAHRLASPRVPALA